MDVIQGQYLSKIVYFLHKHNIFQDFFIKLVSSPSSSSSETCKEADQSDVQSSDMMTTPAVTATEIAKAKGYDTEILHQLLLFVSHASDLLLFDEEHGRSFRMNPKYVHYHSFGHYLDKVRCYAAMI